MKLVEKKGRRTIPEWRSKCRPEVENESEGLGERVRRRQQVKNRGLRFATGQGGENFSGTKNKGRENNIRTGSAKEKGAN